MIPDLLPSAALTSANSLTSLSQNLLGIVAPGLGTLVVAAGGTAWAFEIDGLSFFFSASCLLVLLRRSFPAPPPASASWFQDVREGLRLVRTTPWLWVGIGLAMIFTITNAGAYYVIIPFLVRASFLQSSSALGAVYGLAACGSIVAAIIIGQFRRLHHRG